VTRGWLGVGVQAVTPDIARSFGLAEPKGALITELAKGGPADVAGIRRGDVIISFNGIRIKESHELPAIVARTRVGERAKIGVIRDVQGEPFGVDRRATQPANSNAKIGANAWGMTVLYLARLPSLPIRTGSRWSRGDRYRSQQFRGARRCPGWRCD
jgi:serine protease Do